MKNKEHPFWSENSLLFALIFFAVFAGVSNLSVSVSGIFSHISPPPPVTSPRHNPKVHNTKLGDILKQDCEHLVQGQLLFHPEEKMRQGSTYLVFARISRDSSVNIARDIASAGITIEPASVSCEVFMRLDGQESEAFDIVNSPPNRPDKQFVEAKDFTQWSWHVTPKKSGTLHLLLYVTPYLFVEGINEPM